MENDKLVRYLSEIVINNPLQAPLAMIGIMQCKLMLMIINIFSATFDTCANQFEDELKNFLSNENADS